METKEFSVFQSLLNDVFSKAFDEPVTRLPHGKAQTLCWLIHETTDELLSYKTLSNYAAAVLENAPAAINPSHATLAILAKYVTGQVAHLSRHDMRMGAYAPWYKYRSNVLARRQAA
jgi:hypothetical protein